jgi:hypothetical protein
VVAYGGLPLSTIALMVKGDAGPCRECARPGLLPFDEPRTQAVETATELLRRSAGTIWNGCPWQMTVADAAGDTLFALRFSAHDYGRAE